MKILKKIGKVLTAGFIALKALVVKAYAVNVQMETVCDYGVFEPVRETSTSQNIALTIIVPVIMLIGLIIFLIKSTGSILKKTIISIGVVLAYILIRILIKNVF